MSDFVLFGAVIAGVLAVLALAGIIIMVFTLVFPPVETQEFIDAGENDEKNEQKPLLGVVLPRKLGNDD
jgi:hypothetical protein